VSTAVKTRTGAHYIQHVTPSTMSSNIRTVKKHRKWR